MRVPLSVAVAAALCTAVVCWTAQARAYRPFDGTDADVAELGEFELELGPVHWYSQGDAHSLIAPATVLNLGYAPGWELVVDLQNYVGIDRAPGKPRDQLLDTDILTKVVLLPGVLQGHGARPSVALELGPLLPNVNGEEGFGASADLIVSARWQGITLHLNNWLELTRGALHPDWFEGVILEGNTGAALRPVSEWFVERELVTGAMTYSGLVGGIWRATDGLDLDAGLREANVAGARATEVRLGLTWTIGVWHPKSGHGDEPSALRGPTEEAQRR
jgi:hypothetical protein